MLIGPATFPAARSTRLPARAYEISKRPPSGRLTALSRFVWPILFCFQNTCGSPDTFITWSALPSPSMSSNSTLVPPDPFDSKPDMPKQTNQQTSKLKFMPQPSTVENATPSGGMKRNCVVDHEIGGVQSGMFHRWTREKLSPLLSFTHNDGSPG